VIRVKASDGMLWEEKDITVTVAGPSSSQ